MVAFQTENTIVALEVHPGSIGILFPELAGHVVVGADQFRDCISLSEADADGMPALLTAPGKSQIGRRVRLTEIEAPVAPLLETELYAALVFLNLSNDRQSCSGCQCFDHGAAPSSRALSSVPRPVLFERLARMHVGPFEGIRRGPVSGPSACGQRRFPRSRSHQSRCVVERAPPLLDRNLAVEEKGIKNHLSRIAVRPADYENRRDVILPLNSPGWVVGRFRSEKIRGAGGKHPNLRRGQASVEQPPDHKVCPGVAPVRRKPQRQVLGRRELREDFRPGPAQ